MSHEKPKIITAADVPKPYSLNNEAAQDPNSMKIYVAPRAVFPEAVRASETSHPTAGFSENETLSTIYARPEMRSSDKRDNGHIVGGWEQANMPDGGAVLTHERFGDIRLGPSEMIGHAALQRVMGQLPVGELGSYGQPLPKVELETDERDSQGREYVDAAVLAKKSGRVAQARAKVSKELEVLDAVKPIPFNNPTEDVGMIQPDGTVVSYAEGARLGNKRRRDAARATEQANGGELDSATPAESGQPGEFDHLWNTGPERVVDVEAAAIRGTPEELARRQAALAEHARRIADWNAAENARVGRPEMGWRP